MPYGNDVTVYVEDKAGDLGAPGSVPSWLSPDVDIPAHPGVATQGVNQVQVRVHAHDEPVLQDKIVAEVYVGQPSLVMSPGVGTKRIDPGTLRFRTVDVSGTEPVATVSGATLTFPWTPSSSPTEPDGVGHRCLIVRAFPENVTPPTSPFDVPNEQHEAQRNIEVLSTTMALAPMGQGGAGTPRDPRRRDEETGMWWEELGTVARGRRGRRFIVCAFDPRPAEELRVGLRDVLEEAGVRGFSHEPPQTVALAGDGEELDPGRLLRKRGFPRRAGLGQGLFAKDRLVAAAAGVLGPRKVATLVLRFDHSNLSDGTASVLHVGQWSARGQREGGMTIVVAAPR